MKLGYIVVVVFCFASFTSAGAQARKGPRLQTAQVLITESGYSRTSIKLRRDVPARITFLRQTENTCATVIVISAYGVHRELPLNTPTVVSFTPKRSGEFSFTCGMNMLRGTLVIS